jgi:hypothetical protein
MATVTPGTTWANGDVGTIAKLNLTATPTVTLADGEVTAAKVAVGFPVQVKHTASNAGISVTTTGSLSAVPTTSNTQAYAALDTAITPSSASNKVLVRASIPGSAATNGGAGAIIAIFRNDDATALVASYAVINTGWTSPLYIEYMDSPGVASATTYKVRASKTTTINWNANLLGDGTGLFGSLVSGASMTLTEIKA